MVSPTSLLVPPLPRLSQRDSAFTHVTACMLAKSPSDSLHQRLQQSRCLHCCSDCYRVERTSSRAGLTPAVDHHFFAAHPVVTVHQKCVSEDDGLFGHSCVCPRGQNRGHSRTSTPSEGCLEEGTGGERRRSGE